MQSRTTILALALALAATATATAPRALLAQADDDVSRQAELESGRAQMEASRAQMDAARAQMDEAEAQMEAAREQMERAARQLVIGGNVVRLDGGPGFVTIAPFDASRAEIGATLVDAEDGALVTAVAAGSGAADAGLKVGDLIRTIDGIDLADGEGSPFTELSARLSAIEPGDAVQLVVERGGEEISFEVETRAGSGFNFLPMTTDSGVFVRAGRSRDGENFVVNTIETSPRGAAAMTRAVAPLRIFNLSGAPWGDMELVPVTPELGRYFETTEGLLVVRAPSDAAVGLEDGDVILSIGGRTPTSAEHAIRILGSFEPGEVIEFSLMRDGRRQPLQYTVEERGFQFTGTPVSPATPAPPATPAAPATPTER